MLIYNTLGRKKEEFVPAQAGKANMYVCGITAYDLCHIGHARSALVFDVLSRQLRHMGLEEKQLPVNAQAAQGQMLFQLAQCIAVVQDIAARNGRRGEVVAAHTSTLSSCACASDRRSWLEIRRGSRVPRRAT